jgi:phosphoesterase RecJ-like protein
MKKTFEKIVDLIKSSQKILITSHRDPDGDSIGSQLALDGFLQNFEKPTRIINQGPIPKRYAFLDPQKKIENFNKSGGGKTSDFQPDLILVLECPSLDRLGEVKKLIPSESKLVNIDHHPENEKFGSVNYLDAKASAVGEMIYSLLKACHFPISSVLANQIYASILTDTGRFRYSNTSAKCLSMCAQLVKLGADPKYVTRQIYFNYSLSFLKLLGTVLRNLEVRDEGKVCSVTIDQNLLSEFGVDHEEIEGIVDYSLFLSGVEIGLLFTETEGGKTKVNLRSQNDFDVSKLAKIFGGGGHKSAAGCTLSYNLDEAKKAIFEQIPKLFQKSRIWTRDEPVRTVSSQ